MSNKQDQPFDEIFHSLFYDVVRSAGVALNSEQLDKIRSRTKALAKAVEIQAERKAIEVAKRLQNATSEGFNAMAEEIDNNRKAIDALNSNISPECKLEPFTELWEDKDESRAQRANRRSN